MLRGEVYLVDLGPGEGREPVGIHPVVVVTNDTLNSIPLVIAVVPGVDAAAVPPFKRLGVLVPAAESGLTTDLVFLGYGVRGLDPGRFPAQPAGQLPAVRMAQIDAALRLVLELP